MGEHRGGARPGVPHRAAHAGTVTRKVRKTPTGEVVVFRGRVTVDGEEFWAKQVTCRLLPNGKRLGEATAREEAWRNLRKLQAELEKGVRPDPAKERETLHGYAGKTVGDDGEVAFEGPWRRAKRAAMADDTPSWRTYEVILDRHVLPWLGRTRLARFAPTTVLDWRDALLNDPDDPRSVDRVRAAEELLRVVLRDAKAAGYPVDWAAIDAMRPLAPAKKAKRPHVDEAQFLKLLDTAAADPKGEPWRTMYVVAFFTAMRASEVCGLRWRAVWDHANQIEIAEQLDPRKRKGRAPKAGKQGVADVPAEVIALLADWRKAVEAQIGRPVAPDELVFSVPGGKVIAYDMARWALNRHRAAAKLPGIGWHSLRRGFATAQIASATAPLVVQQLMRHSDFRTTQEYLREVPGVGRDAAEKLAERTLRRKAKG